MDRLSLGKISEGIAVEFLKKNRFKIIQRNFSCRVGELDIIAKHKNVFVFIEVRSTRGSLFHYPADSITPSKICKLKTLALIWLKKHGINNAPLRFDVVGIVHNDDDTCHVNHIKDAF
jgi:putative endonuclease